MAQCEVCMDAFIVGTPGQRFSLALRLHVGDILVADDRYSVVAGEVHRTITLSPGIDDFRNALLWSPKTPTLIDAELDFIAEDGRVVDSVASYTALRSFAIEGNRFVFNGRPYPLRMVLDQAIGRRAG